MGLKGKAASGRRSTSSVWRRPHLAFLLFCCAGTLLVFATPALGAGPELTVTLNGPGAGTVAGGTAAEPTAIACSNSANPGGPGTGACTKNFGLSAVTVNLTATAAPGYTFTGWSGTGGGGCNSGTSGECEFSLGITGKATVDAGFIPTPDLPLALTGASGPGPNALLTMLAGTVDPQGFELGSCRFEVDIREYEQGEGPHGTAIPCTPAAAALDPDGGPQAVSGEAELEQLTPSTTYHYRLVAANIAGSSAEAERTFQTPAAPPDDCPNATIRDTQPLAAIMLPDCMALELVSPPGKENQPARLPNISAGGDRVQYESPAVVADTPNSITLGDAYVASRGGSGWTSAPTAPPAGITFGWNEHGKAQSFTPDLSRWLLIGSTEAQRQQGIGRAFQGGLGGLFAPLSPLLVPSASSTETAVGSAALKGASEDLSHLYFQPGLSEASGAGGVRNTYLPGDPLPNGAGSDEDTYVAHLGPTGEPSLELVARDSAGKVWGGRCGTRIGGTNTTEGKVTGHNQGAVSADGARAYFSTRPGQSESEICRAGENKLRIMVRSESVEGPQTKVEVEELISPECDRVSPPCKSEGEVDGDDFYEAASLDQSKVYFTTNRQLADSDLDGSEEAECSTTAAVEGCDLYLYDSTRPVSERLTQVSAGDTGDATPGRGARVLRGVTAVSTDGSHAYFVAEGALTGENSEHESPSTATGARNLYLYERDAAHPAGHTAFIATLDPGDRPGLWGRALAPANNAYAVPMTGTDAAGDQVGGDGHVLFFISKASLTAEDADGGRLDLYRYDGDADPPGLSCVSCRPGGPDAEPFGVIFKDQGGLILEGSDLGADFAENRRWAGDDGESAVFKTAEGLVPGDADGAEDSYLWHFGRLYRLPGTEDPEGKLKDNPTVSADGAELAFQSFAQLLPFDTDTATDVYAARAGGGFPVPSAPPAPCQSEEECQGQAPGPLASPGAASETQGAGNPAPQKPKPCPKGKRKVRRHGKARCLKPARHRKHKKHARKAHRARHANADRRAAR